MIGAKVLRREDDKLLRGEGCFVDDLPEPAGTLHLAFVLSPHAHARIVSIDAAAARAAPGVVDVFTAADFAKVKRISPDYPQPGYQLVGRPVMAVDRVRFVGELVAVVVAQTRNLAEDAVELVEVDYDVLPALVNAHEAAQPGAAKLHEDLHDNVLFRGAFKSEGFEEAFGGADVVVKDLFHSQRLATVSIEPRGCLAQFERSNGGLTIWTGTQIPHIVRTALAELLDWEEQKLRVVAPDVGGGFGMKAYLYPEEIVAAALARRYRGAVKWIGDRRDDLLNSNQARDYDYEMSLAFRRDGTLLALKARIVANIGAYPTFPFGCSIEAGGAALYTPGPYRLRQYAYEAMAVATNLCPTGAYRGVGQPVCAWAAEALMDRAAHELGMDPAELRLKNVITKAEFPWVNVLGIKHDPGSYEESLREALEAIGYADFRKRQPADRLMEGKYRGIGIGCVTEHTGQGGQRYRQRGMARVPGFDAAMVRMEPNGKVIAYVSHTTQGQGHLTAFAQIIAERMGVSFDDVTVMEGDTATSPYGTGTFASRGAVTGFESLMVIDPERQLGDVVLTNARQGAELE